MQDRRTEPPRGFTIRPTPPLTQREDRRLRRWLRALAEGLPEAAERLRLERGVLRIRTAEEYPARVAAGLAGAALGRHPFTYTLSRDPGPDHKRPAR